MGASHDLTLKQVRTELERLVSLANTAERPKPTTINPPGHAMPGHEWTVVQRTIVERAKELTWTVRTVDEAEHASTVYVSSPDSMYPAEDLHLDVPCRRPPARHGPHRRCRPSRAPHRPRAAP
ncbi:hypothetical protein ACXZ65_34530 [Streptomyces aculeolatus]